MSGFLAVYGTEFEELEDEAKDSVSKKPLRVEEQIVTDERGRRRFHGAFTGGFSAGYFNTVGTKEGWKPREFKSSRAERTASNFSQRPEDYMDDDDLGEFGIAPRQVQTTRDFDDEKRATQKHKLAWERTDSPATSTLKAEADALAQLIKPVSESFGVRLLKRMGWRQGKGIGPTLSRKQQQKLKATEDKTYGCDLPDDVPSTSSSTTTFEFAPDDVALHEFAQKTDTRGIGYQGIDASKILSDTSKSKYSTAVKAANERSRGIRGQAFGVGAYEEDDEDVYALDDMNKYDFAIGGGNAPDNDVLEATSSEFAEGKRPQPARKFYAPPQLPRDFDPRRRRSGRATNDRSRDHRNPPHGHTTVTAADRARAYDENAANQPNRSIMEYLKAADRARLQAIINRRNVDERRMDSDREARSSAAAKPKSEVKPEFVDLATGAVEQKVDMTLFASEPKKHQRFVQFVSYVSRGLTAPQPLELSDWEWDRERASFTKHLPDHLRDQLSGASLRKQEKPLAGSNIARPFAHLLAGKFTKAKHGDEEDDVQLSEQTDERVQAVKMGMFGAMTRTSLDWHPDKTLCKRFNLPDPYPGSDLVGCPALLARRDVEKSASTMTSMFLGVSDTLPSTAQELENKRAMEQRDGNRTVDHQQSSKAGDRPSDERRPKREPIDENPLSFPAAVFSPASVAQTSKKSSGNDAVAAAPLDPVANRPSLDLFRAVFCDEGEDDQPDSEQSSDEDIVTELDMVDSSTFSRSLAKPSTRGSQSPIAMKPITLMTVEEDERPIDDKTHFVQINTDIQDAPDMFGPALPPHLAEPEDVNDGVEEPSNSDSSSGVEVVFEKEKKKTRHVKREISETHRHKKKRRNKSHRHRYDENEGKEKHHKKSSKRRD